MILRDFALDLALSILLLPALSLAQSHRESLTGPSLTGVGSCSSSNCHGAQSPRNSSNVLQNEYVTWAKQDKHSEAYKALLSPKAKRMAHHLGISAAEQDSRCLSCHSLISDPKGEQAFREDGVSCESCHGAASGWLKEHTEAGATHARNLENGMSPISELSALGSTCLRCHLGSGTNEITHKLYGAGHPQLSFELDTFLALMPPHWNVDQDYRQRKSEYLPAKTWLFGLRSEALEVLVRARRLDPESAQSSDFSIYYCTSCHHALSEQQYLEHEYLSKPGEPRLNISSLLILNSALFGVSSGLMSTGEILHQNDPEALTEYLNDPLSKALSGAALDRKNLTGIYKGILEYGQTPTLYYEDMEKILMGLSALESSLPEKNSAKRKNILSKLYKLLEVRGIYNSAQVRSELEKLSKEL